MTRNTFTKARIILIAHVTKMFTVTQKVDRKTATKGEEYSIRYNYEKYYAPATGEAGQFTYNNNYTRFSTLDEAKKYFREHRKEIAAAAKFVYDNDRHEIIGADGNPIKRPKFKFTNNMVDIVGEFQIYLDTSTGKEYYSLAEAEKICKNHLFIERRSHVGLKDSIKDDLSFFTIEREKEALLFEFYQVKYNDGIPQIVPHWKNRPFRLYSKEKAYYCNYNEKTHKYVDAEPLYKDDGNFCGYYYYHSDTSYNGYTRSVDANERYIEEDSTSGDFTNRTLQIIKEFGIPEYHFTGYSFNPSNVDSINDLTYFMPSKDGLYSSSETQICKDVTDFLANIPFDKEHSVVKFRNGYILRLGTIAQAYKCTTRCYDGRETCSLREHPIKNENGQTCELVYEEYVEFARLFISNSFSTRSLSLATEGGRRWRHDGIHLVSNLFQSNPEETHLGVDVEANNRAALETLYTIHPKLKYMKKYMEQHPDVLYNSCVPFLRALFQYNMILETFIALKKDDIFWTPVDSQGRSSRYYYSYRSRGDDYTKKKETFDMEHFVEVMGLKSIPQSGDFYQRLGLTKQQFKLIFANMDRWENVAKTVFKVRLTIPGDRELFSRDGRWYERDKVRFKLVSYEEFRMVVEIANKLMDKGEEYYSISNNIDNLNGYYKGMQRVYKAMVTKEYDCTLLQDYLRMRKQLDEAHFPDFKLSIWDMFPDDNEDLRRYHDRIMFLYNECEACKTLASNLTYGGARTILNPATHNPYTPQELYLYGKSHGIFIEDMTNLVKIGEDIRSYSNRQIGILDIITKLPESPEDLEAQKERLLKMRKLLQNLHYMYWGDDDPRSWRDDRATHRARSNWGGLDYAAFLTSQLSNNLDKDKYDLYLRLRRKFIENMEGFRVDNYPVQLQDAETLERLYQELAAQEPELDAFIARRERERQRRIQEEREAKTAEQQKKYVERYKKLKTLNYEDGSDRCIVVPQNLVSLIVEGQTLHHCVGSFVDSVSEGKDTIVFLRKVEDKETPYVTISLQPDGKFWFIDQAHGDRNSDISEEDVEFLKGWAQAKGIVLTSVKQHYGAHCHN